MVYDYDDEEEEWVVVPPKDMTKEQLLFEYDRLYKAHNALHAHMGDIQVELLVHRLRVRGNMAEQEEIETAFYQNAANRKEWSVFTEDPVWVRKLEKIGAVLVRDNLNGGKTYTLRADQVLVRAGKRQVSDEQKAKSAERMAKMNANAKRTREFDARLEAVMNRPLDEWVTADVV